jgi:hypothetical protein
MSVYPNQTSIHQTENFLTPGSGNANYFYTNFTTTSNTASTFVSIPAQYLSGATPTIVVSPSYNNGNPCDPAYAKTLLTGGCSVANPTGSNWSRALNYNLSLWVSN